MQKIHVLRRDVGYSTSRIYRDLVSFIDSRRSLVVMVLTLSTATVFAQSNLQLIPQVAPSSPDAASLGKFGNYKVSHFTGLPTIAIPLYEINVGEMSVPITINYHASGIKVSERSSWVGLGWSLSAGGQVTRKVMGREDEHGYLAGEMKSQAQVNSNTVSGLIYLKDVNRNNIDTEPDVYSYSLPGGANGKFVFNAKNNFKPLMIPYDPIKILKEGNEYTVQFSITDTKGVNYKMNEVFETTSFSSTFIRSAWLISKMISPHKQDTIKFNYTARFGSLSSDITDYFVINDNVNNPMPPYVAYYPDNGALGTRTDVVTGEEQKVNSIIYPYGKVVFEANTDRQDFQVTSHVKKLDRILVYNTNPSTGAYILIKSIEFHQSYFTSTDGASEKRLRLDSLSIKDSGNAVVQKYRFDYNTTTNLPAYHSRQRDYWGYYNGKANNTLVPNITNVPYQSTSGSSVTYITVGSNITNGRASDPSYMQANVLTKIHFPTGGRTEFSYETNKYQVSGVTKYAGGLRVTQVKSFDSYSSNPLVKTYVYGTGEDGFGRANFILDNYSFQSSITRKRFHDFPGEFCSLPAGSVRTRTFVSTASIDIEPFDGSPVVYPVVTEYEGDVTNNVGKTIYTFTDEADLLVSVPTIGSKVIRTSHYERGLLSNKSEYKKTGPSSYQLTRSLANTYQAFPDSLVDYIGFKCSKVIIDQTDIDSDAALGPMSESNCPEYYDDYSYIYGFYYVQTGDNKLVSTTETIYDQFDVARTQTTSTTLAYGSAVHQQVTSETSTNTVGQTLVKTTTYPHETTGTVYSEMIQNHLWAYPIEERIMLASVQQSKIRKSYYKYSSYVFKPQTIFRQIEAGPEEAIVNYAGYDLRGNPSGYTTQENVLNKFLWGYKGQFPIATATFSSATSGEIAYTSFENAANEGNWTFNGSTTTDAKTGLACHQLSVSAVSKSGLISSEKYVVSYYGKGVGAITVTGVIASNDAPTPDADGWQYFEKTVTGSSSITISGTGSSMIDEVRLFPIGGKMTTYIHSPNIGVKTITDPNGISTYYDYDAFGRLQVIRDAKKNILKSFQYHYKGQN